MRQAGCLKGFHMHLALFLSAPARSALFRNILLVTSFSVFARFGLCRGGLANARVSAMAYCNTGKSIFCWKLSDFGQPCVIHLVL